MCPVNRGKCGVSLIKLLDFNMTKAQKKIVSGWSVIVSLIITFSVFNDWILENWDTIRWPAFIVILIFAALSNKKHSTADGRFQINRVIEENPWIKIYLAIYSSAITIGAIYVIFNNIKIEAGFVELFTAMGLLILPIIIIQQKEAYLNAGKEA